MYELHYYKSKSGDEPFTEWLESLDLQAQVRISVRLDRVKLGNFGDSKLISGGIYELRFTFGSGYRVYFGKVGKKIILLLTGGDKKTQSKDIQKVKIYWRTFLDENSMTT